MGVVVLRLWKKYRPLRPLFSLLQDFHSSPWSCPSRSGSVFSLMSTFPRRHLELSFYYEQQFHSHSLHRKAPVLPSLIKTWLTPIDIFLQTCQWESVLSPIFYLIESQEVELAYYYLQNTTSQFTFSKLWSIGILCNPIPSLSSCAVLDIF